MTSPTSSSSSASASATALELDPAPDCASDIWIDHLPHMTPEQYRTVRHFQVAVITAQKKARTQAKDPKLRESQYPDETEHQWQQYKVWTKLQDTLDTRFWRFVSWLFGEAAPDD